MDEGSKLLPRLLALIDGVWPRTHREAEAFLYLLWTLTAVREPGDGILCRDGVRASANALSRAWDHVSARGLDQFPATWWAE